jgi:hypothetical protein
MANVYQPYPYRARRPRRHRMRYTTAQALADLCAIVACALAVVALTVFGYYAIAEQYAPSEAQGDGVGYALVMVYNAPNSWREIAVLRGVGFGVCDRQQRAVWARDVPSVTLSDGQRVPSVDAYCVANDRLPSGVETMRDIASR